MPSSRKTTAPHPPPGRTDLDALLGGTVEGWLATLVERSGELGALAARPPEEQAGRGYVHTLREIAQQPVTWRETATAIPAHAAELRAALAPLTADGTGTLLLTGSGSSLYAGECLAPLLQSTLRIPVQAVAAGELLTHPQARLPPRGPCLIVSFARSGNSPESCGVVDTLRESKAHRHLIITCNGHGRLATRYRDHPRVTTMILDDKTCDRSLVMTSSFSNMVVAGRFLGQLEDAAGYRRQAEQLSRIGAALLLWLSDPLAEVAGGGFGSAMYLGSGCRFGSAREAALKMLEMTDGEVTTFAETYLGLRHGPMCAVDEGTLVVGFLSCEPVARAYEVDLVRELKRKRLGARLVLVGEGIPAELIQPGDLAVECPGLATVGDQNAPVADVLVGQLLAFFRCLSLGLRPDSPSRGGVITRVVEDFEIHRR